MKYSLIILFLFFVSENISVCVAGYPQGYTSLGGGPHEGRKNMQYLKNKVGSSLFTFLFLILFGGRWMLGPIASSPKSAINQSL